MLLFNKKQRYILYFIHLIKTRFFSDDRKQRADEGSDFNQIFVFYNSMLFLSISKEHINIFFYMLTCINYVRASTKSILIIINVWSFPFHC